MIEVVNNHISELAEGPLWDKRTNCICWIDIRRGEVHELNIMNQKLTTTSLNQSVGSITLSDKGNFLMAMQEGLAILDRKTYKIKLVGKPEENMASLRFNDGKCDPAGRFWVGTMSDAEIPGAGSFYKVDHNFRFTKSIEHVTIPNGLAWSKNGQQFYFIDTPTGKVVSYCFNKIKGEITNAREIISIPEKEGSPDGMTIDAEGMLWIAHWNGWKVTRWNPVTGEKLYSLFLPVANVTSCAFGGKNLSDLYITSAKVGLSQKELKEQPHAGSLFVWKNSGYKGRPTYYFIEK